MFTSGLSVSEFLLLKDVGLEPLGLVTASSCVSTLVDHQMLRNIPVPEFDWGSRTMYAARRGALDGAVRNARALGAVGIVGLQLVGRPLHDGAVLEVTATGTAVSAANAAWFTTPFTAGLSGQNLWRLLRSGYAPMGFLVSSVVSTNRMIGGSVANLLFDGRDVSLGRLHDQARGLGAAGVVVLQTDVLPHAWAHGFAEHVSYGTAVRRFDPDAAPLPDLRVSM